MKQRTALFALTVLLVAAAHATAEDSLKDRIEPLVKNHEGTVAVSIKHLPSGESLELNGDLPMPTANLIKFPVMIALHDAIERGDVDLATPIRLTEEDKVPGSGILTANFSAGTQISLRDALRLMIVHADTHDNKDRGWTDDNAADVLCGKIAKVAYDHFNPDGEPTSDGPKVLRVGADGELVEALQRTLNARLKPSHNLGIDGDFGPATQGAVAAFQTANGLTPSGEVDAATWKALGTLITEDAPVADPRVINREKLPRDPPKTLDEPPRVTCKAWAIGDGKTGQLRWGFNEEEPLHPASTTKIMTGYLVTSLAQRDPPIWDEIVTFSERADKTSGSSCRLKAGEKVPVRELLYGLLLPSGNDASVSLAEHFGNRAFPTNSHESALNHDKFEAFVGAMNATAKKLGMKETHYENTHGLTEETHLTSARDLLKLAHAAMQQEEFSKRTNTRRRGCTVEGASGYKRNVLWTNTNHLLKIEGYDGVKTGTTNAAGCCLVSRGNRDGQQLILVVLGSATSEARYVDSENLYQWAWRQLAGGE